MANLIIQRTPNLFRLVQIHTFLLQRRKRLIHLHFLQNQRSLKKVIVSYFLLLGPPGRRGLRSIHSQYEQIPSGALHRIKAIIARCSAIPALMPAMNDTSASIFITSFLSGSFLSYSLAKKISTGFSILSRWIITSISSLPKTPLFIFS